MSNRISKVKISVGVGPHDSGDSLYLAIDDSATTAVVSALTGIANDDVIRIEDEDITVAIIDATVGGAVVVRGAQGSTPATHAAATAIDKLVDTTNLYTAHDAVTLKFAVGDESGLSGTDKVTVDNEQLLVDAVDSTVGGSTVVRGVQGSTAAVHAAAADVFKLVDTTRTLYVDHDAATLKFAVSSSTGISGADKVTLGNEQLLVDAVDTTVGGVAVTRAQSGTVGATHAAGAAVDKKVDTTRVLNGGINDVVTSITLDDTTGISNGDTIIIEGEQVTVTTVFSGTVLNPVVRGANGTTNVAHDTGKAVFKRTAASTTLYIATSASATALALDTIANLANGDVIVIGAEQIAYVTETATVDGFTVLARGANSTVAAAHVAGVSVFLVTDTTDNLYVAASVAALTMAFDAIAGFADGDTLLIGAERITCTTKNAAVGGFTVLARGANSTVAAAHVVASAVFLVTDTTDTVYVDAGASDTRMAFDAIAGFADGDTLLIGAERITVTAKNAAVGGFTIAARGTGSSDPAPHAADTSVFNLETGHNTGSADSDKLIIGEILMVKVDYSADEPNTLDLVLKTRGADGSPSYDIYAKGDSVTDVFVCPRKVATDPAGAAIAASAVPIFVADYLTVTVAQADYLTDAVDVTVWYRDMSR